MLCHVPFTSQNEDPKPGNLPKLTVNETVMRLGLLLVPIVLLVVALHRHRFRRSSNTLSRLAKKLACNPGWLSREKPAT